MTYRLVPSPALMMLALLAALAISRPAAALDPAQLESRLFGTLGVASSSSDHVEFRRDISQPDGVSAGDWSGQVDSLLGVQVSYLHSEQLEATAQAVVGRGEKPDGQTKEKTAESRVVTGMWQKIKNSDFRTGTG